MNFFTSSMVIGLSKGGNRNLRELAGFFGWIIVVVFAVALCNYILKFINKKWGIKLKNYDKKISQIYTKVMKYVIKYHKVVGGLTIVFILIHFAIMYYYFGFNISGMIAAISMFILVLLGVYGSFISKQKRGTWLYLHKVASVVVLVSIIVHLL